ncbi:ankyrin repeat-containing domain protein [Emericellopsis atlantica]|uniref:Ankyrin repeat-containing domain protein n=1 Tax=Emericellopsis atlantica TaxID=2614577 RepID=A0A9P8CR75_9HYPO|nr:ankyrin repeat-containing domain protein [Emericellopsis atlantica]KAG9256739.1 ankyrin repeat-containing domain protein [Emericellopsis atlantica]
MPYRVNEGADVELYNSEDNYAGLFEAATSSQFVCFQLRILIACGAHVNTFSRLRQLPLTIEARRGCDEVVEILLRRGSDGVLYTRQHIDMVTISCFFSDILRLKLNLQTAESETPLHAYGSCKLDSPRCAKLLIKRGASVSLAKNNGWMSVDEASQRGLVRTIIALVAAGADPNSCRRSFAPRHTLLQGPAK